MFASLLTLLLGAIALPPKPARYVTDNAGVLPADRAEAIDAKLKSFEQSTSDQIIVYIDHKVPGGTTLEEMSSQAVREWGVGQKGKSNGAILFLFTDDRKMRIEVGYGLEGSLTDARTRLITSELMKPRLKNGDYAGAVDAAVNAMMNFARGEDYKGSGRTVREANAFTSVGCWFPFIFFLAIVGFIIFMATYGRKRGWVTTSGSGSSSSNDSWSSSSSSSSDSSSSSSDFSGGDGDSGGGGSSDSW
jgi:uncharacterized protein